MKLNHQIMELASRDTIMRAADDLRLRKKNGVICFDSESDTHFLMDRVIHDISIDGRMVIELFRDRNKGQLTVDEQKLLDALVDCEYSLFIVQQIDAGHGLRLLDAFSEREIFLVDVNLSRTAVAGHLLATRVVSLDGIMFTTGCACPFPGQYLPQLKNNFVCLFEEKKYQMTWEEMMRRHSPYFFITMKQAGVAIDFGDAV